MSRPRVFLLTALAMIAFAANSLLCRLALRNNIIDPATFTLVRIASGAAALWLVARVGGAHESRRPTAGSWPSAIALFLYAAAFSFAYVGLSAATGALLLFGAVQATMILAALRNGERLVGREVVGLTSALGGLVALLLPGLSSPPVLHGCLMLLAGIAWGVYSLRGKRAGDPLLATCGNFLRAAPIASVLSLALLRLANFNSLGLLYAFVSGAITSGIGYVVWYAALRGLPATTAAVVQLSVPVLAALGGILLLGEHLTIRFIVCAIAVLGGIGAVLGSRRSFRLPKQRKSA